MLWTHILAGFMMGFLGSFHCIGMCGPIALALPVHGKNKIQKTIVISLYNIGRALMYAGFGAVLGFISNRFFLVGYQQSLSIVAGVAILLLLAFSYFSNGRKNFMRFFFYKVQAKLGNAVHGKKNTLSYLTIGMLNGLLPCGLVYLSVAASLTTGSALNGAAMMFSFGLGTFPLMMLLMVAGQYISFAWRRKMRKAIPYFIACMGILLILRGMNLNIPYISPQLQAFNKTEIVECH